MKKVRKIKILLTTREILVTGSETCAVTAQTELPICPTCHSRIAEAVGSAIAALSETERQSAAEFEMEMKEI